MHKALAGLFLLWAGMASATNSCDGQIARARAEDAKGKIIMAAASEVKGAIEGTILSYATQAPPGTVCLSGSELEEIGAIGEALDSEAEHPRPSSELIPSKDWSMAFLHRHFSCKIPTK